MGKPTFFTRLKHFLIGKPRDLEDQSVFHRISLIPILAWVGLGSDGLSSSAYGPEEAFKALGEYKYLAVALALLMATTVFIISAAYRRIIEDFPHGGGGYVVASKLLGKQFGVVSGSALLIDYILTITISIAAAGDALFSFLPIHYHFLKIPTEIIFILGLTVLNARGVKESVLFLTPVFLVFLITHVIAIFGGVIGHIPEMSTTISHVQSGFHTGINTIGFSALFLMFIHAYSLGGGTYTGIEAVSNGLPIMREPKVQTAKRTMTYMATSLALTASGLLFCYLLWNVTIVSGKTMNAVLFEKLTANIHYGLVFVVVALISEGLLLVVAAQAGFIDGPRVLANMAADSWLPRKFASVSERLTTGYGILFMSLSALLALFYTKGNVSKLVVMYSINVFLTFSLSIFGMLKSYVINKNKPRRKRGVLLFAVGFLLCATILVITTIEKFEEGGWITLTITALLVGLCFIIKSHYTDTAKKLHILETNIKDIPKLFSAPAPVDLKARTAVILVGGYGRLGLHTFVSIQKTFPGVYKNFIFISVGVVDSEGFKGENGIESLKNSTERMLEKYVATANELGCTALYRFSIGTDVLHEGFNLCEQIKKEFPQATFFAGKVIFSKERWYQRILHNETGLMLQKRLQLAGLTMVILPAKVT